MTKVNFKGIPTFRILDYGEAIDFYIHFLGFDIDWEHRFGKEAPVYMQVSKCGLSLHLSENKRFQTGVIVFVESENLQEFHIELTSKNPTNQIYEIVKTDWGTLQMEIEDPFSNLLRFNETI